MIYVISIVMDRAFPEENRHNIMNNLITVDDTNNEDEALWKALGIAMKDCPGYNIFIKPLIKTIG